MKALSTLIGGVLAATGCSGARPEVANLRSLSLRDGAVVFIYEDWVSGPDFTNCVREKRCYEPPGHELLSGNSQVSWTESSNFCKWRGARLPTFEEWSTFVRTARRPVDTAWLDETAHSVDGGPPTWMLDSPNNSFRCVLDLPGAHPSQLREN